MSYGDAAAQTDQQIREAYWEDPILMARQVFPHWFKRPMPWLHRGMIAILLRRSDFLLNFGEETWAQGRGRWTKKHLAKLVRHFVYKINPADPKSPTAPIFRVRYASDGRTPVAIDMVIGRHFAGMIPRGFSKTTVINFVNTYKTLHKMTKFTVYISEAAPHAEDQLATVRRELSGNERIVALYGQLKPDRTDEESWGAKGFETRTGVKFAAKGRGAQIRGLNKFGNRPDCLVFDDVEDKESVSTDTQREKTLSWYVGDAEPALDRDNPDACCYVIGTMLDPKALLPTLCKDPDYTAVVFGARIPTGEYIETGERDKVTNEPILRPVTEALWDDQAGMSLAALDKIKNSMAAKGKLYNYYLEYESTARDDTKLKFRQEYIRYRRYEPKDFVARAIHVDPALAKGKEACFAAIAVVGIMEGGHKHVCDFWAQKGQSVFDIAEQYFQMKMAWDCTHHSCEATAFQQALAQVIRSLMFRKASEGYGSKAYFEIIETWPHGAKLARVEGVLQPIMASGYLTFQQIWPELETMFIDWPTADLDGPDVIAGAISTLEPFAALNVDEETLNKTDPQDRPDYEAPCPAGNQGGVP